MMGGSTKIGIGRTTRVKAVSMIAWGKRWEHCAHASFQILLWVRFNFPFHGIRWVLSDGSRAGSYAFSAAITFAKCWKKQRVHTHVQCCQATNMLNLQKKRPLTCLAAILEDPTTFPLSSSTSIPSDSSLCLIRPTLQMFALAEDGERGSFYNLTHFQDISRCWRQEMQSQIPLKIPELRTKTTTKLSACNKNTVKTNICHIWSDHQRAT